MALLSSEVKESKQLNRVCMIPNLGVNVQQRLSENTPETELSGYPVLMHPLDTPLSKAATCLCTQVELNLSLLQFVHEHTDPDLENQTGDKPNSQGVMKLSQEI